MEIFVFWILCGAIASMIGARKGEGFTGFVIGILLGPIGVIVVLLSKGNRKKCPFCAELVNKEAIVCPHCQRDLK